MNRWLVTLSDHSGITALEGALFTTDFRMDSTQDPIPLDDDQWVVSVEGSTREISSLENLPFVVAIHPDEEMRLY